MRVSRIEIKNILGIEQLEIKPGSITEVSGANGTGKTSVLESIKGALGSGHDATLLRSGAEQGEVVLILDDGVEISKKITVEKSTLSVKHPEFGKITKSQAYIQKLVDALSLNPVAFLTAPAKERVDLLLKAIPMTVTADQLAFVPVVALEGIDLSKHALEVIGKIGKAVYDLRTGVNRAAKEKRATASQMRETLPSDAEAGQDWKEVLDSTLQESGALQRTTSVQVSEVKSLFSRRKSEIEGRFNQVRDEIRKERDEVLEKIRYEAEQKTLSAQEKCTSEVARLQTERDADLARLESEFRPKEADLKERIGQAKAMVEAHTKAETTRSFIAKLEQDSEHMEGQSEKLTASLDGLESLKTSLLSDMPIKGLEIRDSELFLDGVPFDRINASRKVRLAIQVAGLRAGNLPLVCVDGLELLDPATYEAFKKEAAKSKLQFLISRVTSGDLTITTGGEAKSA